MLKMQHFTFISSIPKDRMLLGLERARQDALIRGGGFLKYGKVEIVPVQRIADGIDLCHLYVSFECIEEMVTYCQKWIDDNVVGYFKQYDASSFVLFGHHLFQPIVKE